ncbi:MAG: hypothetical protein ABIG61_02010 [Planctomycetota bacterium]
MSDNLKRKIERIEKMVGISESADPRASCYPNNFGELTLRAYKSEEEWQQFLRTRHSKPYPEFWDWLDQQIAQLKVAKNN